MGVFGYTSVEKKLYFPSSRILPIYCDSLILLAKSAVFTAVISPSLFTEYLISWGFNTVLSSALHKTLKRSSELFVFLPLLTENLSAHLNFSYFPSMVNMLKTGLFLLFSSMLNS